MVRIFAAVLLAAGLSASCSGGSTEKAAQPACVADERGPITNQQAGKIDRAQRPLRGDQNKLRAYGAQHEDEFTELMWDNGPPVKLVGYFSKNLDRHRAALVPLLEHPDRLELRRSLQSDRDRQRIMQSLDFDSDLFTTAGGRPNGTVHIDLRTTAAARKTATDLRAEWGDLVCLRLGSHPFPKGAWPDTSSCPKDPAPTKRNPAVRFTITLDKTTLRRGEIGTGTARIQNMGTAVIETITGTDIGASVTKPGSNRIVGALTESHNAAGLLVRAEPGGTAEIPVRFGTEDCEPNRDYSLPPGQYVVSSYVEEFGRSDDVKIRIVE